MELQQVRYFLGVSRTLNFTRAAMECNVSQPALTRSIKQLEEELGGELIRREGRHSHLTELGQRMRPLLQQCYESASTAKLLAGRLNKGEIPTLSVAISWTVSFDCIMPHLDELQRAIPGLRIRLLRGSEREVSQMLKDGEIDLAIGGPLGDKWDRLEIWPLFKEAFDLVVSVNHELARWSDSEIDVAMVRQSRFLAHSGLDHRLFQIDTLNRFGIDPETSHQVDATDDMESLIAANFGVALMPASSLTSSRVRHVKLCASDQWHQPGGDLTRTVAIYGAAGRTRSRQARGFLDLVRSANWPRAAASKQLEFA